MTRALVFAYHNVGVRCLSVLLAEGVDVARVVTHPDAAGENIWFASVADLAERLGLPVSMVDDPNDPGFVQELAGLDADFLFSFYYRRMLGSALLALPRRGALNLHGSLLPQYRGRVPVNWAVLRGENRTGATLHYMVDKPDAGDIVDSQAVPILPNDTAAEVFGKVTVAAEMVLARSLAGLLDGSAPRRPQDLSQGSYFGGRKPEDGRIDWRQDAQSIHNLVRAVAPPFPGAFCDLGGGRLRVLSTLAAPGRLPRFSQPTLYREGEHWFAQCGDGRTLRILALEYEAATASAEALAVAGLAGGLPLG